MKLSSKLTQFSIEYPALENTPKNLLNTPAGNKFSPQSRKLIPFREQYANEAYPHKIRHCDYQFGTINRRRAIKFYHRTEPIKLVYSNQIDPLAQKLIAQSPPRTNFPATTVTSPIARSLREFALKWITDQFFSKLNYLTFDEPIVDGVNPDCLVVPASKAHQILHLNDTLSKNKGTSDENSENKGVEITDAMFVEIKAYHGSTQVGEKEVLQAFNYATKGGKTLLLTTGELGDLKALDILNEAPENPEHDYAQGYDPEVYAQFSQEVKRKNRALIKRIDMAASQDSFDTRGIYISASTKIKKAYKYTKTWPRKVAYSILSSPDQIMEFISSSSPDHQGLGLVQPEAFVALLRQFDLKVEATLFENVRDRYLEEILMDPTLLYPH